MGVFESKALNSDESDTFKADSLLLETPNKLFETPNICTFAHCINKSNIYSYCLQPIRIADKILKPLVQQTCGLCTCRCI